MKKKLLILLLVCVSTIGAVYASVNVKLSCGKTVSTVDWTYFETQEEWEDWIMYLDKKTCFEDKKSVGND